MTITFHPPTGTKDPFNDFDPKDKTQYPEGAGIYIYGIRSKVDNVRKFIPIVVGESADLRKRLYEGHYNGKFFKPHEILVGNNALRSGDPKELWDFSTLNLSRQNVQDLYNDTAQYNLIPNNAGLRVINVAGLQHLIFFQDANFYHHRLNIQPNLWKTDLKIEQSIYYLHSLSKICGMQNTREISELSSKIISSLFNFKQNFYFVYAAEKKEKLNQNQNTFFSDEKNRKAAEHQLKQKLKSINIHTTADDKNIQINIPLEFDLTNIQEHLVNIGGHPYDVNGEYKNLVIK